jgi:hypothetical protein
MTDATTPRDAAPWSEYVPSKEASWDVRRVVHLHRRAGFAATWNEIQRDLKDGPRASITRVLAGKARGEGVPANFNDVARLLAESSGDRNASRHGGCTGCCSGPGDVRAGAQHPGAG